MLQTHYCVLSGSRIVQSDPSEGFRILMGLVEILKARGGDICQGGSHSFVRDERCNSNISVLVICCCLY